MRQPAESKHRREGEHTHHGVCVWSGAGKQASGSSGQRLSQGAGGAPVAKAVLMMVSPPGVVPTQDVLSMLGDIRRNLVEVRRQGTYSPSHSLQLWEQGCLP